MEVAEDAAETEAYDARPPRKKSRRSPATAKEAALAEEAAREDTKRLHRAAVEVRKARKGVEAAEDARAVEIAQQVAVRVESKNDNQRE